MNRCYRWLVRPAAVVLVLVGALVLVVRLALPAAVGHYRGAVERTLSETLNAPATVQSLDIDWWGWQPILQLTAVQVKDPTGQGVAIGFDSASVHLEPLRSLLDGQLRLRNLRLRGGELNAQWSGSGFNLFSGASAAGRGLPLDALLTTLRGLKNLDVRFNRVGLTTDSGRVLASGSLHLRLLRSSSGTQRLDARLVPERGLGGTIAATVELAADDQHPVTFYIDAPRLLPSRLPLSQVPRFAGKVSLGLWGRWSVGRSLGLTAELEAQDGPVATAIAGNAQIAEDNRNSWRLSFTGEGDSAAWNGHGQIYVADPGKPDLPIPVNLSVRQLGTAAASVVANLRDLRIRHLAPLAAPLLPAKLHNGVAKLQGQVGEVSVDWQRRNGKTGMAVAARFGDVSTAPQQQRRIPGIGGLSGTLRADAGGGELRLDSTAVAVQGPPLRSALAFDRLSGTLDWRRDGNGWRIHTAGLNLANVDLDLTVRGNVLFDRDGPLFDLQTDFREVDIARFERYLPAELMNPKTIRWLDHALVSGRIKSGAATLVGRAKDLPFERGEGHFESRFLIENMSLNYANGWPRIEQLGAEVAFVNRSLAIDAYSGRIHDTELLSARAEIGNLAGGPLQVDGKVRGAAPAMLGFVQASPLAKGIGQSLRQFEADGEIDLQLGLTIPLRNRKKNPVQIDGVVELNGNTVRLASYDLDFRRIKGEIAFSRHAVHARDLNLVLRGDPAQLDITTDDANREMRFRLRGALSPETLLGSNAQAIAGYFGGRSAWDVLVRIASGRDRGKRPTRIELRSDLQGTRLDLPAPMGKTTESSQPLSINGELRGKSVTLAVEYAPSTRASLLLQRAGDRLSLERGALHVAAGNAALPNEPGLAVQANLPRFELASFGVGGGLPPWLSALKANVENLWLAGKPFGDTRLSLQRADGGMQLTISGPAIAGTLQTSHGGGRYQSLRIVLSHLDWPLHETPVAKALPVLEPTALPALDLDIERLSVAGTALGRFQLKTVAVPDGLRLATLALNGGGNRLAAHGSWLSTAEGQNATLSARLDSEQLGNTLNSLGYDIGIEQAPITAELDIAWPGSLLRPQPQLFKGNLGFEIGKGRFLRMEPGLGRVLGLVNVSSLARRLKFDFSDLFASGYAFDNIDGQLRFADGQARIDDLFVQGPAANLRIDGRIGLSARDYDQNVTVMPQLGSSLAIAGAIAGGPAVGAAVLVAEQLLKPGFDSALAYRYKVTGSWDDPVVELISAPSEQTGGYNQR